MSQKNSEQILLSIIKKTFKTSRSEGGTWKVFCCCGRQQCNGSWHPVQPPNRSWGVGHPSRTHRVRRGDGGVLGDYTLTGGHSRRGLNRAWTSARPYWWTGTTLSTIWWIWSPGIRQVPAGSSPGWVCSAETSWPWSTANNNWRTATKSAYLPPARWHLKRSNIGLELSKTIVLWLLFWGEGVLYDTRTPKPID